MDASCPSTSAASGATCVRRCIRAARRFVVLAGLLRIPQCGPEVSGFQAARLELRIRIPLFEKALLIDAAQQEPGDRPWPDALDLRLPALGEQPGAAQYIPFVT